MRKKMDSSAGKARFLLVFGLVLAGLLFLPRGGAQAAETPIDAFTTGDQPLFSTNSGDPFQQRHNTGTMMGGHRWLDNRWIIGGANVDVQVITASHYLGFSAGSGTIGRLLVTYNGSGTFGNNSLNQDFSVYSRFIIRIINDDWGADNSSIRVYTDNNNWSESQFNILPAFVPTDHIVSFGSFIPGVGALGGVVWSNVNRVELKIRGSVAQLDFNMDDFLLDCVAPTPQYTAGPSANPNPITGTCPPPAQNVQLCWTANADDGNTTVTVYNITGGAHTQIGAPLVTTGANQCISNVPVAVVPSQFRFVAHNKCNDNNATVTVTCQTQGRVPSLNEWGLLLLALIMVGSALWQLRKRRS